MDEKSKKQHGGLNESERRTAAERGTHEGPPAQEQRWPGDTSKMRPRPDHGEESYRGAGKLEGRAALITGGDSGIGRAVAIAFAREGADVAITCLEQEEEEAQETLRWVKDAGRRGLRIVANFERREDCRAVVERAAGAFGRVDVLVNNAAYQSEVDDILAITAEQLERTFRVNIFGYFFVAQAALQHMKEGGVILNTGSVTAMDGSEKLIDYASTKGAIHAFTKSLAQSLAPKGIRVNCVAPGPVWTPLIPATLDKDHVERFGANTMWERPAQPSEIAPSYVFLASEDGRYYTGEILAPTGRGSAR